MSKTVQMPAGIWTRWTDQPTDADLRDVYLSSQGEGWAVGGADVHGASGDIPTILRLTRGQWSIDDNLPEEGPSSVQLNAVDGTGPDNVWVAGQENQNTSSNQEVGALLHYDGIAWEKVLLPNPSLIAPLTDIDVVPKESGFELWAISQASARNTSYILHYDGLAWDVETIQNRSLLGIHMLNTEEGQIVTMGAGGAPDGHHLWYHNSFWQATSVWTPQPLNAVSMAEPTFGWAVGNRGATDEYVGQCHNSTIDCRWNARQAVRSPGGSPVNTNLLDVQMVSHQEGWLVGEPWGGRSTVAYLVQDSNPEWLIVPVEDDPAQALYGLAMWAGADGRAVEGWAVGADGTILHYAVPPDEPTPAATGTATPLLSVTPSTAATFTPTRSPTSTPSRWSVFLSLTLRSGS
ncbi:MAG: hypothetical protein ACE5HA_05230 [Anaerolineae bacterium]